MTSEPSVVYPDYVETVALHIRLMMRLHESYYGVASEDLLRSALERPRMAAQFEEADLFRQAAHLLWGLINAHPFRQGNKRTGVAMAFAFIERNGMRVTARQEDIVALGFGVAEGRMEVEEVEGWLRERAHPL